MVEYDIIKVTLTTSLMKTTSGDTSAKLFSNESVISPKSNSSYENDQQLS